MGERIFQSFIEKGDPALKLCTWSQACGLKDATDENCRVRIKYYKRMADALDHINLNFDVSADGKQPRADHGKQPVARQLLDRQCYGDEFPTGMVLSCNPKAYVYKEELKRTVSEGMASRPTPIILKLDDYACHKEKEFVQFCEENHIYISPTKGGLTPKEQVLDQAANGWFISMLQTAILCACWRLTLQQTSGATQNR